MSKLCYPYFPTTQRPQRSQTICKCLKLIFCNNVFFSSILFQWTHISKWICHQWIILMVNSIPDRLVVHRFVVWLNCCQPLFWTKPFHLALQNKNLLHCTTKKPESFGDFFPADPFWWLHSLTSSIIVTIIPTIMFVYSWWTVGEGGTNCISITVTNPSASTHPTTLPSSSKHGSTIFKHNTHWK